ncbi:MAG: epoxyqueuosine reductase [Clostridia bacterium]|nr:epoxyqueuosine reductase [Clostridia bacterium]
MLGKILENMGVDTYAAIPVSLCRPCNMRLYSALPCGLYAVFMLFPYRCEKKNSRLAAFASVPDYHVFAKSVFTQLEEYIVDKYDGAYAKGFADHSPLDEKHGAASCGLGIIGRHGLLISEKYSSFVCIGEFICSLTENELRAEGIPTVVSEIKGCENCGKCISACPSGCVEGSKETCVSAVTQKKGELTESERALIRQVGCAWGCDICQNACPHTKRAEKTGTLYTKIPYFCENNIEGDEKDIIALSDEDYKKYTFSYRKRNVMMRNIEIIGGLADD